MTTTYELYTNENGTPKAVEGKAPAILERVEALEEKSEDCLPKSGGTMTGGIKTSFEEFVRSTTNDSGVRIYGGNGYGNGSYIALRGKDYSEKGIFTICASDGTSNKLLKGTPDGSLTWGGNEIITSAGGTFTGVVKFSSADAIERTVDNSYTAIRGGSAYANGASLVLYGKDEADGSRFRLIANDGTKKPELIGQANGNLIWGGKNIVRSVNGTAADASGNVTISVPPTPKAYVTATWKSGANWYRKWSDGYIEQGGTVSPTFSGTEATVTVNTSFAGTAYFFDWVSNEERADNYYEHSVVSKTATTVMICDSSLRSGTYLITWYACGY